jgi:hypothetical protein
MFYCIYIVKNGGCNDLDKGYVSVSGSLVDKENASVFVSKGACRKYIKDQGWVLDGYMPMNTNAKIVFHD